MAIENKLNEVIERHLDEMATLGVGSEEMLKAIKAAAQLHALRIEEERISNKSVKLRTRKMLGLKDRLWRHKKSRSKTLCVTRKSRSGNATVFSELVLAQRKLCCL